MTEPESGGLQGVPATLLSAAARLLRPLIRLLIAHHVPYPSLAKMLKGLYVEVARDDFRLENRPMTQSRVSVLTGVHRKDVRALWEEASPAKAAPSHVSLGSQVVIRWATDPRFVDGEGRPRALTRTKGTPEAPGFDDLVASVTQDVWPRAILDEWLRLGVTQLDAEGCVVLQRDAYVPEHGFEEKVFFLGRNVGDHLSAAVANVEGREHPFLEREVHYLDLSPDSVAELAELAGDAGADALKRLNQRGAELKKRDASKRSATQRIAFGVYFFSEPTEGDDESGSDST